MLSYLLSVLECNINERELLTNKRMTTQNNEGMKDVRTSNVCQVSRKPLQCIHVTTQHAAPLSHSEAIAMLMICSITLHNTAFFQFFQ